MMINNLLEIKGHYGWSYYWNDNKELCLLCSLNNKMYLTKYKKEPLINEIKFVGKIIDIIEETEWEEQEKEKENGEYKPFPMVEESKTE